MDEFGNQIPPVAPSQNPSSDAVSEARSREQQDRSLSSQSIKAGEVLRTFSVMEGAPYTRSRRWMWTMLAVVFVLLGFGFGLDGANSLTMAVAFVALIVVYAMTMRHTDPSRRITLTLTTYVLQLAGKFYPYAELGYFYITQFPDYVQVTLQHDARFSTGVELFLELTDDIEGLRSALSEHVRENLSAKETPVQKVVRLLQL